MTTVTTAPPFADAPRPRAWASGLGEFAAVGGLTPFLYPLSWILRKAFDLEPTEYIISFAMFAAAFVINDPHFAVTYFLFYKNIRARAFGNEFSATQKIRYWLAGFVAPVGLIAWGISALVLRSAYSMGLMIQLMFFLVGWHYVKQGFGVFSVLSARRGVRFDKAERWAILGHCYAGWMYAWATPRDIGHTSSEKGIWYVTLPHPRGLDQVATVLFLATIPPLVWVFVSKWKRDGRLPILTPLTALLCSVWPWLIFSNADPLLLYMIPALHSIQYLYFVWLLEGNKAREREGPPHFERSATSRLLGLAVSALALGWFFFHIGPEIFDTLIGSRLAKGELDPIGPTPCFAALFAFVNIHHYCMDAVIWRRENPETRYLQVQRNRPA
ncbi:MAG: hypothetical protein IPM54_15030 [Polyangiaceae bacterium]|nr:hypothetical protein [Polyangiaceae bacterium]